MSWPVAESQRRHVAVPHRRPQRVTWVLVAAAFLCGGLLSAAGFSIGWKHEAQRGSSAQSALLAATSHVHTLTAQLAATRSALVDARAHGASLAAAKRALTHAEARLRGQLAAARQSLAAESAAAAPLSGDLARLTSELRALTSYVTQTPSGQLDAGYLQAQVAYLSKTANGLSAALAALAAPRN